MIRFLLYTVTYKSKISISDNIVFHFYLYLFHSSCSTIGKFINVL